MWFLTRCVYFWSKNIYSSLRKATSSWISEPAFYVRNLLLMVWLKATLIAHFFYHFGKLCEFKGYSKSGPHFHPIMRCVCKRGREKKMGLNQLACACLRVISIHGSRLIWTRALPSHWMTHIDPNAHILQRVFFLFKGLPSIGLRWWAETHCQLG